MRGEVVGDERAGPEGGEVDDAQPGEGTGGVHGLVAAKLVPYGLRPGRPHRRRSLQRRSPSRGAGDSGRSDASDSRYGGRGCRKLAPGCERTRRARRSDRSCVTVSPVPIAATGMRSAAARSTISATRVLPGPGVDHRIDLGDAALALVPACEQLVVDQIGPLDQDQEVAATAGR